MGSLPHGFNFAPAHLSLSCLFFFLKFFRILSPENPYVQGGFMLQLKPNTVFTPQGILFSVPSMIIDTSLF